MNPGAPPNAAISGAMASSESGPAVVTWIVPMRLPSSASARPPSCAAGKCWASIRPPLFALSVLAQASKALVIGVPMPSVWAILQTNFF
jgi:hypothetical protein